MSPARGTGFAIQVERASEDDVVRVLGFAEPFNRPPDRAAGGESLARDDHLLFGKPVAWGADGARRWWMARSRSWTAGRDSP